MNNTLIIAAVIVIVVLAFAAFQFGVFPTSVSGATGRAVFTISDPAGNLQGISSIEITVDNIQVQSATQGWINVSSTPKTYDLLNLNASSTTALLADAQLQPGTYEQLRLHISQILITDANGTHVAILPSGDLRTSGTFVVNANQTSSAMFDFNSGLSVHVTGNGSYVFAPVVHLITTENATVDDSSETNVHITGGTVDTDEQVGMDINGNVGVNLEIPTDANVTVDANGSIGLGIASGH